MPTRPTLALALTLATLAELGVAHAAVPAQASWTCAPGGPWLCLGEGRYRVEAETAGQPAALGDDIGYFGAGEDDIRLVLSYEDGGLGEARLLAQSFASHPITLRVTDLASGEARELELPGPGASSLPLPAVARVTVTLDRARSVSALVPATGGAVTAVGADGTVFKLTIPKKALLSPETITLTPVKSVAGLPFKGGFVAAVHLEPAGLRLFSFATLTIQPPKPVARNQEVTFGYRGTGQELFLYPPVLGSGLAMKILHFSGYGVAKGTTAEQSKQQLRLPTRAEDRFSQKLQALVAKRRRGASGAASGAAATPPDLDRLFQDFYTREIKPKLPILRTNCEQGKAIASTALNWARSVELMGYGGEYAAEIADIQDALLDGLVNCYDEAHRKCVDNNDPSQVTALLSYARALSLLGGEDRIDLDKIERCVRFELQFESVIDVDQGPPGACVLHSRHHHVRAKVPLRMEELFAIKGSAPLDYLDAFGTGSCDDCSLSVAGRVGSEFTVESLSADFNLIEGGPPVPPRITMIYAPGLPLTTTKEECPGSATFLHDDPLFAAEYGLLHAAEYAGVAPGGGQVPNLLYFAREWKFVGSAASWAEKDYDFPQSFPDLDIEEDTFFLLRHTPE